MLLSRTSVSDWKRIGEHRSAQKVVVGLAGSFDEAAARADLVRLGEISQQVARLSFPLIVVGWYLSIEIAPTWEGAAALKAVLDLFAQTALGKRL
jgi:hypothetical protein